MTLVFRYLEIRLLWIIKVTFSIQEGGKIRNALERLLGGKTVTAAKEDEEGINAINNEPAAAVVEKRPSVYSWIYADDDICVAEGSSGSLALWGRMESKGKYSR
jgi:hypothetical protein